MDPTVIYFEKLAKNLQIERKNFKLFENFLGIGGLVEPQLVYRKWFWLSEVNRKLIVGYSDIIFLWHHMKSEKTWFWNENRYGWNYLSFRMYISSQFQSHGERDRATGGIMPSDILMRVKVKILIGWASHPNRLLPK